MERDLNPVKNTFPGEARAAAKSKGLASAHDEHGSDSSARDELAVV